MLRLLLPLFFVLNSSSLLFSELYVEKECSYSLPDSQGVPLDEKLLKYLNFEGGTFIEAGAHDGVYQSNTNRLEKFHDWKGILIEPSPNIFEQLTENRPNSICFQCALGTQFENGKVIHGDFDGATMSSINGNRLNRRNMNVLVHIRSLQSILDEVNITHVNFFSLDTEGYELNILQGIDFNKTTFDYLLIEVYDHQFIDIVTLLNKHGYKLIENLSNYNYLDCPGWGGDHNDFLFCNTKLLGNEKR